MKTYNQLTRSELNDFNKVMADYFKTNNYQNKMSRVENCFNKVAPSGGDLFDPHLWKDAHWRWYFETIKGEKFYSKHKKMMDKIMFPWKK